MIRQVLTDVKFILATPVLATPAGQATFNINCPVCGRRMICQTGITYMECDPCGIAISRIIHSSHHSLSYTFRDYLGSYRTGLPFIVGTIVDYGRPVLLGVEKRCTTCAHRDPDGTCRGGGKLVRFQHSPNLCKYWVPAPMYRRARELFVSEGKI